jgi:hypothetical protein
MAGRPVPGLAPGANPRPAPVTTLVSPQLCLLRPARRARSVGHHKALAFGPRLEIASTTVEGDLQDRDAVRLDRHEVAALDRRDFQIVAPRHLPKGGRLRLLPED